MLKFFICFLFFRKEKEKKIGKCRKYKMMGDKEENEWKERKKEKCKNTQNRLKIKIF